MTTGTLSFFCSIQHTVMSILRDTSLAFLLALVVCSSAAQPYGSAERVDWKARVVPETVVPGDTVHLLLEAEIEEGWKMYGLGSPPPSQAVSVTLGDLPAGLARAGEVLQSRAKGAYDPSFQIDVEYHIGEAKLALPIRVAEKAGPGDRVVTGSVRFMVCTDTVCLPPTSVSFEADFEVDPDAVPAGRATIF